VSELLAQDIISDIASRRARPGDTLPSEAALISHFGVGRGSMREALRILEIEGIITMKTGPGGGAVVSNQDPGGLARMMTLHLQVRRVTYLDLLRARSALEPTMARLVAESTNPDIAEHLNRNLEQTRAIAADDPEGLADVWADFHELIGRFSGNPIMDLMASALQEIYRDRVVYREPMGELGMDDSRRLKAEREHAAIARAIISGNGARAQKLMHEHMERILTHSQSSRPALLEELITWH
jgi:GntR family transcriptional repressor for pyruvate dehydrogenase complex